MKLETDDDEIIFCGIFPKVPKENDGNQQPEQEEFEDDDLLAEPTCKRLKQKAPVDPTVPALQLDSREEHFIDFCPHHDTQVRISRPITDQSSIYCSPNCIRLHVEDFLSNWTSGLRSLLLINSANHVPVIFTGIKEQLEKTIESNQMLRLFRYIKTRNRQPEKKTPKIPKEVNVTKKQCKRLKTRKGKSVSGKEKGTSTSVWKPLTPVEVPKGDKRKDDNQDKKAEKRHHKGAKMGNILARGKTPTAAMSRPSESSNVPVNEPVARIPVSSSSNLRTVGPVRSQAGVYSKLSSSCSSFTVACPLPTKKINIKSNCGDSLRSMQAPPEPTGTHEIVNMEPDQEVTNTASASTLAYLPVDLSNKHKLKLTCSLSSNQAPPEPTRTHEIVNKEPDQGVIYTTAPLPGEPSSRPQLKTMRTQSVSQPAALPVPPATRTSVWQGFIEKVTGEKAIFPVIALPLTANATPHWFEDSGFVSKEPPITKRIRLFGSNRAKMFALLQGDFELAVVHFTSPTDRSNEEKTFHYLTGIVGYCYKKGDRYLTHLFVYPLGDKEPLPEILQSAIAPLGERPAKMLLGLLVRKGSSQTPPPAAEMRRPVEEEIPERPEAINASFPIYLPNGAIDKRIQTNRTATSRRDPRRDPQLSGRAAAVAMQTPLPQPVSFTSKPPKAARAPPQEPVNDFDEMSNLNAENDQAFYRLQPIGQRIPVLLNRVPE